MDELTTIILTSNNEAQGDERQEAMARVSDYFATEQFIKEDGYLDRSSIPDFLRDCQTVLAAGKAEGREADALHTFELLTGFFEYLLDAGETTAANSVFDCVQANLANICRLEGIHNAGSVRHLSVYLAYAVPDRVGDLSNESWSFINLLMDEFASDELKSQPYLDGKIYEKGDFLLSLDLLLSNLLNTEGGDMRFTNVVTTILARRYGFKQHKMLDIKSSTKRRTYARYSSSEAMNIFRIWGQCDGRSCLTLIEMGETDDEDVTRKPTPDEITMRRVQKVRRNFQVLEELKDTDSLKVARKLYRTNGIANFNRYSIETLSKQYEIQVSPYTEIPDYKIPLLTILPYSDYNGAFEGEHYVGNETNKEMHEVIIEAGSRREALVAILRSVRGTASRQRRNQNLYQIPFEYLYVAGHSDSEEIELSNDNSKVGMLSSIINIQLIEDPELYNWLHRHMLIDDSTTVILGGCKTAEDKNHDPSRDNLAKTVMRKLGVLDVIAAKTSTYRDQIPVIHEDYKASLSQTGNRRKSTIVSIAEVLGGNLT